METVSISPGPNMKPTQAATSATVVKWREPVAGFPEQSSEDFDSKVKESQLIKTSRENDGVAAFEKGVPSSVIVVSQSELDLSHTDLDRNNRGAIQSRARARRNDEPAPFLCIDNLPVDTVIVDGKSSASTSVRKPPPPPATSTRKHQEIETVPSSSTRKGSAHIQSPGPSRATPKSTPRNTPSAGFYNYNSFFTHKNPAFLAGPPNLWSLNNRFWPHATPQLDKSNLPPLPSALSLEAATLRQNSQVMQPFKHGREAACTKVINERAVSPSFDLKTQTVKAIHDVSRQLSKQSSSTSVKPTGRLLKGRLQPLHTFKMDGPSIEKCQGIQPEGTTRSYTPSQSRLLQRKRELLNMLPPDIFQATRPQTQESIHRTSVASNWDETRYNDFESDLGKADIDSQQLGQPSRVSRHSEIQPPNSPIDQANQGARERINPTIPENTDDAQRRMAASPRVDAPAVSNGLSSQSMSDLILADGGASQILSRMVDRVKVNSAASDPGVTSQDQNDPAPSQEDQNGIDGDARKIREKLKRAKSEPALSVGKLTLANHVFRGDLGSSLNEHLVGDHRDSELPASEAFDVILGDIYEVSHSENAANDELPLNPPSNKMESSVQPTIVKEEVATTEVEDGEKEDEAQPAIIQDSTKLGEVNGNKKGSKFFISEPSEVDRDSVRGSSPALKELHTKEATDVRVRNENEENNIRDLPVRVNGDIADEGDNSAECKETENSAKSKKESCKEENLRDDNKDKDDDDNDDGDGGDVGKPPEPSGNQQGTGRGSQDGDSDDKQPQAMNDNNSDGERKAADQDVDVPEDVNQGDFDDIPDIDEAVLFCGHCGEDIDECQCNHSTINNVQQEMSYKELALVSKYERILSAAGVMASRVGGNEYTPESSDSRGALRLRPESAPCMMVMRGTGLGNKRNAASERHNRENLVRNSQEVESSSESQEESGLGDISVIASVKPRHNRSKNEQLAVTPPMGFRINARPPDGMVYYFAYGMDMNADRLQAYTGRVENIHRLWGVLYGFQLQFNRIGMELSAGGFPNIVHCSESSVEGCVYCLSTEQMSLLDNAVGCPKFCVKVVLPVWMLNCEEPDALGVAQYCIPAVMYIAKDSWVYNEPLCNSYNLRQCLVGGDLLSPLYQDHLQSLMCHCCS